MDGFRRAHDQRIRPRRSVLRPHLHRPQANVRTGIEHIFLPGESLWAAPDKFTAPVEACAHETVGSEKPSASCSAFLKSSERARQQWDLERRFHQFESEL